MPPPGSSRRSPSIPRLVLLSLTLFLVVFPLTLEKPGFPMRLKSDEPAYYMMASSLWHDRDLRLEQEDLERLFREFPERTDNLHLMSDDGWRETYYSSALVYPLLAAPWVGLFGANGMGSLNAALFMASIWLAVGYLRRFNGESVATLYASAFFLLSSGFAYVFWLQTEVMHMFCVTAAFYLVFDRGDSTRHRGARAALRWPAVVGSAILLAVLIYGKPPFAALALPLVLALYRQAGWRSVAAWCAAAALTVGAIAGLSWTLTKEPWPYVTGTLAAVSVSSPVQFAERKLEGRATAIASDSDVSERYALLSEWLLPRKAHAYSRLGRSLGYFVWGRHVGFLAYLPFAALSLVLWGMHARRSLRRGLIPLSIAIIVVALMLYFPDAWHGGGGSLGNRFLVSAYPAFLFLVTTVSPTWIVVPGFLTASLFLGSVLLAPFGLPMHEPTLQGHTRNLPYRLLPVELTLMDHLPGYRKVFHSGVLFHGRTDAVRSRGPELWLHGAKRVGMRMISSEVLEDATFRVRSLAPRNEISLCLAGDCQVLEFSPDAGAASAEVTLHPGRPARIPMPGGREALVYRLQVRSRSGEQPRWRLASSDDFYLGAALTYLGSTAERARDVFAASWESAEVPERAAAGRSFRAAVRVRNESGEEWPEAGATQVALSYHWLTPGGERVVWDGTRTPLPRAVPAGEAIEVEVTVEAPDEAGAYLLVLDLVRENVDWFSVRRPEAALTRGVEVVAGGGASGPGPAG